MRPMDLNDHLNMTLTKYRSDMGFFIRTGASLMIIRFTWFRNFKRFSKNLINTMVAEF